MLYALVDDVGAPSGAQRAKSDNCEFCAAEAAPTGKTTEKENAKNANNR